MAYPITWFEVRGHDTAKLRGFYGELLGMSFESEPGDYATTPAQPGGIGGGIGKASDDAGWVTVYADVPDLAAAIAQAERLGGRLLQPVKELPELSFAIISDPEGHPFGLLKHK